MNTERTLVFAGENETDAKQLVATLRARDIGGSMRSAFYFDGPEPCGKIIIMPDVPGFHADKIREAFPGKYDAPAPKDDFYPHAAEQESAAIAAVAERNGFTGLAARASQRRRGRPRKNPL